MELQTECPECGCEFPNSLRECPECWFEEEPIKVHRMNYFRTD
jgi:predicted amidophosphoribosyltransferase